MMVMILYPRHTMVAGYNGSRWMSVCLSVRPSVSRTSICILFLDDNLSKHKWIVTKLGMCIDIVEIWFGIANGQILSNFYGATCPQQMAGYYSITFLF